MVTQRVLLVRATVILLMLPTVIKAADPGWGSIVNRTRQPVTLDVSDSRGNRSAWKIAPNQALRLRNDVRYTVAVRESGFTTTVDARPLEITGFPPGAPPDTRQSPRDPKWIPLPNPQQWGFRSVWGTRWYRVAEADGRLELHTGFTARDVEAVFERYRETMSSFGFDPNIRIVYQPYHRWLPLLSPNGSQTVDEARIRQQIGCRARRIQHQALADAILDMIVANADDVERAFEGPGVMGLTFYVGEEEIRERFGRHSAPAAPGASKELQQQTERRRQHLLDSKAVVEIGGPQISPEVHAFVRRVVARVLDVAPENVVLLSSPAPAAPAPGPLRLHDSIAQNHATIQPQVMQQVFSAIDSDPFLRTLVFEQFTTSTENKEFFGEMQSVIVISTRNRWRYHGISDDVLELAAIPSMKGMHLRWQIAIECTLVRYQSDSPLLQPHVTLAIETKAAIDGAGRYRPWLCGGSEFLVQPRGANFGQVDLERLTYELQDKILKRCTKPF